MKLGFVSAILAELSFEEVIDFAAQENYSCVEIMCWPKGKAERRYAGVTHIDVDNLDDSKLEYIKDYIKKKGVTISGLGYYPNPLDPDKEKSNFYINHIKKVIDAAHLLEINLINTFIGRDKSKNVDDNFERFKKVWPPIIDYAKDKGVKVAIENCPMYFTNDEWPSGVNLAFSPVIWEKMFDFVDSSNFGLNYDPSHLIWQRIDYIRPIYEFKNRIFHVHIKDAKILEDNLKRVGILATPLEYHLPKLPGLGDVNWSKFFSALTDINYDGPVCVEVEDRSYEGSIEMKKNALRQSRNYLNQFLSS